MHYKASLILVCASLTVLASAAPQSNAAGSGAVAKSTMTQTMVATATIGGVDPSEATGSVGGSGGMTGGAGASDDVGVADGVAGTGAGAGAGTSAAGAGSYDTTGAGTNAGVGAGTGSTGAGAGAAGVAGAGTGGSAVGGAGSGMPPSGSGAGAGIGDGMGGMSGSGSGPPNGKGSPGGEDWEKYFSGKGPSGDKAAFWTKFAGSNGHPHQPVARGWSGWFGGGASKDQGGDRGGEGAGAGDHVEGHLLHARGNILNGGPSWSHVRSGEVARVNFARSMPMGGQGQGRQYQREGQGGSQWGGYGQ